MLGGAFGTHAVGFVAHGVDAAGINPTIVEIEERADGDGVIDGFVGKTGGVQSGDIGRANGDRIFIHLTDKAEQSFIGIAQFRSFEIGDHAVHQIMILQ